MHGIYWVSVNKLHVFWSPQIVTWKQFLAFLPGVFFFLLYAFASCIFVTPQPQLSFFLDLQH